MQAFSFLQGLKKGKKEEGQKTSTGLTSKALWASLFIQTISWSLVALWERTMCSNLPSTGTAVLTTGGNLPNL